MPGAIFMMFHPVRSHKHGILRQPLVSEIRLFSLMLLIEILRKIISAGHFTLLKASVEEPLGHENAVESPQCDCFSVLSDEVFSKCPNGTQLKHYI